MYHRIADDMKSVPEFIQQRQIGLFSEVDPAYGAGIAAALDAINNAK